MSASASLAQCGSAGAGDCCNSLGCDDAECCSIVCAIDPSCCDTSWDADCIGLAQPFCPSCGASCGSRFVGGCCVPHNGPFCDDARCCAAVCAIDPSCCNLSWDEACATQAFETCALCAACGSSAAGSCCEAHANPFCEDPDCCASVCASDPFCCDRAWDETCVAEADELCQECPFVCPGKGDCCFIHDTPGCDLPECCARICAFDPFCCTVEWDMICVNEAQGCNCGAAGGCVADIDQDKMVGGGDLAILLGDWGQKGPADLDGNGTTDGADLATMLGAWGPCPG